MHECIFCSRLGLWFINLILMKMVTNVTVFSFIVKIFLHDTKRAGELCAHMSASLTFKTCMKGFVVCLYGSSFPPVA